MCDFKPGDEVVCIDTKGCVTNTLVKGLVYTISSVHGEGSGAPWVQLIEIAPHPDFIAIGYHARRFRKVQRRDIQAWLETATDFEEPKRVKEPTQ